MTVQDDPYNYPNKERKTSLTEPSADMAALIEAIKAEAVAFRGEEKREDEGKEIREWTTIGLVGCTLVAVCWQVFEMIKVYGPIRDQAIASQTAAIATARAADAATRQSENSERFLIESQRAWVIPKKASLSIEPKVGSAVNITIDFQNIGHEPALKFNYSLLPFIDDNSGSGQELLQTAVTTCKSMQYIQNGRIVFPGGSGEIAHPDNFTSLPENFIDDATQQGRSILVISGCFIYTTFDKPHHTSFCFFYSKGLTPFTNLKPCWNGDDVD